MKLDDLTILTHTHSDCEILWSPYFDSYDCFFPHKNHIVLINNYSQRINKEQQVYKETLNYSDRIIQSLEKIKTNFVLLSFEDMILYDNVNIKEMENIIELMKNEKELFFTRLIKSGIRSKVSYKKNLFFLTKTDFLFSLTPTIWRKEQLLSLLQNLKDLNIWNLEIYGNNLMKNKELKALYYYNNEPPRGGHYDSSIYPHICSAILKGKWNMVEYSDILTPIIERYDINIYDKGIF